MNAQESLITLYFNVIIDFQDSQGSTNTDIQGNVSVKTSDRFFFLMSLLAMCFMCKLL